MNSQETDKIINRLKYAFTYNKFDEPAAISEYKRVLMKYSFEQMNRAIDNLIESTDGKNAPPISAIIKACKESYSSAVEVRNTEHCSICNDKGYILITKIIQNGNESLPYQYDLHCICQVGMSQAYNGMNCKKGEQSTYRTRSVTEYLDDRVIEQLKYDNDHPHSMTDTEKEKLQKQLRKIGLHMPYALDRGDAWEEAPWG